jgi:hypothetical protein
MATPCTREKFRECDRKIDTFREVMFNLSEADSMASKGRWDEAEDLLKRAEDWLRVAEGEKAVEDRDVKAAKSDIEKLKASLRKMEEWNATAEVAIPAIIHMTFRSFSECICEKKLR